MDETSYSFGAVMRRTRFLYERSWRRVLLASGMLWALLAALDYFFPDATGVQTGATIGLTVLSAWIVTIVADEYVHGDAETRREIDKRTSAVYWKVILASFVSSIGILLGLILLVIPGLVLIAWWGLYSPAIMRENRGVFDSLGRSRELVRGHTASAIAVWLSLIAVVFVVLGGALVLAHGGEFNDDWTAADSIAEFVAGTLAFPLLPLAAAAMYDLLARERPPSTQPEDAAAAGQP